MTRDPKALPTVATMSRRILATLDRATPADIAAGVSWYATAADVARDVADVSGVSVDRCAAILAVLSPRSSWRSNVRNAYAVALGLPAIGLGRSIAAAEAIRDAPAGADIGALVTGPKVRAFHSAILGDDESVTVDIWALRVAVGPTADAVQLSRAGAYGAVVSAYRRASARSGIAPRDLQAITWVTIRGGAS